MDEDALQQVTVPQLLGQYAAILAELRRRGVVRTGNAPLGDYAEGLVAGAYGGELQPNSNKSFDVLTPDGRRVQVKARTVGDADRDASKISMFRSFDFDAAVVVAFDMSSYEVVWAREIPADELQSRASYSAHTNAHRLPLRTMRGLGTDVTDRLRP